MPNRPLFSIVIPVHNAIAWIDEAMDSVFSQTLQDYEVILVDDGSTDGSSRACDKYAAAYPGVSVIHGTNRGSLLARREGYAHAQGEYVVSLDADDRLRSDALSVLSNALIQGRSDIILFRFSPSRSFEPYPPSELGFLPGFHGSEDLGALRRVICKGQHTNTVWSKAFRREVLDLDADYSVYRGLVHGDDLMQIINVLDRTQTFTYCPETIYYYRPNPSGVTKAYRPSQLDDLKTVLGVLISHADTWGEGCPSIARNGAILQCIFLVHILMGGPMAEHERRTEFDRIANFMGDLGLFGKWETRLRIDKRLEANALKRRNYHAALWLARLMERMKAVREHRVARL